MSITWNIYTISLILLNIIGCAIVLYLTSIQSQHELENTHHDHIWDDNLQELNNPLPRWWMWLFYLTIVFALSYLVLYPGLGGLSGLLHWDQVRAYEAEKIAYNEKYAAYYDRYLDIDLNTLSHDTQAMATAQNLFLQRCAACHGADAHGSQGFPNLTDNDWLYGGTGELIQASITSGRNGAMPNFGEQLSLTEQSQVVSYLLSFTDRAGFDKRAIDAGKKVFQQNCIFCHGTDATGNQAVGAPNLTDDIWLHGGDPEAIRHTIQAGRQSKMPAHGDVLSAGKIHLLTAYVLSLSQH
ncbi:MAG: cytochrome-c oxidase, cbb3-type subunit III [Gammaproteobacteria bacterium]